MHPAESDATLLARLLALSPADREAFLREAGAAEPALRARCAELLPTAGSVPPENAAHALRFALEARAEEVSGTSIGPYKLLQKLGEGGFGTVWMAEQHEPIRRRVALKIIKVGMDTEEVIARFEAERQALALMEHPNIARVCDAGATHSGRPYFVMELVRGVPITRYCDENKLSAEARLRLFITVCQAVQHAHQKGVIHRDLKPSNILVTLHDGAPVAKIIDFGIAKATSARLTEKTLFTQFHAFIGTPAYTSPEQMEMSGLDVDTRSDIYSLGVLLYELLAGRPPFDPDTLAKSGLEAMRRTIREVDPPRPSQRLSEWHGRPAHVPSSTGVPLVPDEKSEESRAGRLCHSDLATIAAQRSTTPPQLLMLLRGDLDWIAMRCLEKDRTRRYDSAAALAADIERHLADAPVTARPPSKVYQAKKFIRRHKVGVGAATAVALSLVAGLIASSTLLVRERAAHARAVASERAEAGLRQQADQDRAAETLRVSRTARDMAERFLGEGRSAEGLAYLVHAARKNPADSTLAPYLASALASRNFLLPAGSPSKFPARIARVDYVDAGRKLAVYCDDGTIGFIDLASGAETRLKLPAALATPGVLFTGKVTVTRGVDDVIRVLDPENGQVLREFTFGRKIARVSVKNDDAPIIIAVLENDSIVVAETATGFTRTMPFAYPITGMARLSPDGRWWLRTDNEQRRAELCDLLTGERRAVPVPAGAEVKAIGFAPDSTGVVMITGAAAVSSSGSLFETPITLHHRSLPSLSDLFPPRLLDLTNPGANYVVTFNPEGTLVSVVSAQGQQVFATASGQAVGPLLDTAFLHVVRRSDLQREHRTLEPPPSSFRGPIFSRSAARPWMITVSHSDARRELVLRDVATGQPLLPPMTHPQGLQNGLLSEDERTLLTVSGDNFLMLWDVNTGRLRAEPGWQQSSDDFNFALSPHGEEIALGGHDGLVQRLRVGRGAAQPVVLPRTPPAMPAPFLPELPARILWPTADRMSVLDVASGGRVSNSKLPERILGIRYARGIGIRPDLKYMVVQSQAGVLWQAWELDGGRVERTTPLDRSPAGDGWVCFSPRGDRVALGSLERPNTVGLWDLATGRTAGVELTHVANILSGNFRPAAFTPDGRLLAAGGSNGVVRVWDAKTGAVLADWQCGRYAITGLFFDPGGTRMLTVNSGREAQLWNATTGQSTGVAIADAGGAVFSPSGERFLVWGDGTARIHESDTGAVLGEPMEHPGVGIRTAAWSADGRRIVTGAQDSTARLWDARTGRPVSAPMPHATRVVGSGFSPDGRFVRTEQAGNLQHPTAFFLWSVPPDAGDAPAPEWLLQLATAFAGKQIDETGKCVDAPAAATRLDALRRELAALPDTAPFVQWGRWLLDDRRDRPLAPGFALTPAAADRIADELRSPVRTDP